MESDEIFVASIRSRSGPQKFKIIDRQLLQLPTQFAR